MKDIKSKQLDNNSSYLYAQEVKQERKQSKQLRSMRQSRKGVWQAAD